MNASPSDDAAPVARPVAAPVASVTARGKRRGFGRFGGVREPTIRGISPDSFPSVQAVSRRNR